jgi:hypothetical protein
MTGLALGRFRGFSTVNRGGSGTRTSHKYTKYDWLLARYNDRQEARSEVRGTIEQVLDKWEQPE